MISKDDYICDFYQSSVNEAKSQGLSIFYGEMSEEFDSYIYWETENEKTFSEFLKFGQSLGLKHLVVEVDKLRTDDIQAALQELEELEDEYDTKALEKDISSCEQHLGRIAWFRASFLQSKELIYTFHLQTPWKRFVHDDAEEQLDEAEKNAQRNYSRSKIEVLAERLIQDDGFKSAKNGAIRAAAAEKFFFNELQDSNFPLKKVLNCAQFKVKGASKVS